MGFLGFSFGKKRRRSTKRSKVNQKPPARLLRICKKYKVKATVKCGGRRVYKSVKILKKLCLKKAYALKKKLMKMKKSSKSKKCAKGARGKKCRATRRKMSGFGEDDEEDDGEMEFGKRRRGAKTSRKSAMMAFNKFFKRHCAGRRGSRFGSGGNPPLSASMGYEFCPSGMGGVLGANSTGLFPTPCVNLDRAQAAAEGRLNLPSYSSSMPRAGGMGSKFGARRSRFGMYEPMGGAPMFGARRSRFGGMYPPMEGETMFGARRSRFGMYEPMEGESMFGARRSRFGMYEPMEGESMFGARGSRKPRNKVGGRKTKSKIGGRKTKVGGRKNAGGCSAKRRTYGFGNKPMNQKGQVAPMNQKGQVAPMNQKGQVMKLDDQFMERQRLNQMRGEALSNFADECKAKGHMPMGVCVSNTLKFGRRR
jgi:hypothetical protein